jgi:hypothetical protein
MQPALMVGSTSADLVGVTPTSGVGAVNLLANGAEWASVEATQGTYDFGPIDAAVANARSKGVRNINVVLTGTPLWAAADLPRAEEPSPGYSSPPASMSLWANYVFAMANHLKGKVTSYQIWSEANLLSRWHGTPAQLATMTRIAFKYIKVADPAALVVAASTTVRLHDLDKWYYHFLLALRSQGWPTDAFVGHFYPPGTGTPVTRQQLITYFKSFLVKAKAPARPIWDGEINYGVKGPGTHFPRVDLDNATGAGYVARTYLDSLRLGISRVYWSAWTPKSTGYGITMYPGTLGARAQRTTYGWLANTLWRGCTVTGPAAARVVTCHVSASILASSRSATIVWSEGKTARVKVPAGNRVRCTAIGQCSAVKAGSLISVNGSPVWIA